MGHLLNEQEALNSVVLKATGKVSFLSKPALANVLSIVSMVSVIAFIYQAGNAIAVGIAVVAALSTLGLFVAFLARCFIKEESGFIIFNHQHVFIKTNRSNLIISNSQVLEIVFNISEITSKKQPLPNWGSYVVISHEGSLLFFSLGGMSLEIVTALDAIKSLKLRREASWKMKPTPIFFGEFFESFYLLSP